MVCCSQGGCCSTQSEQVYILEELICLNNVILVKQNVREKYCSILVHLPELMPIYGD